MSVTAASSSVVRVLARVDGRRLLAHPVVLAGFAFALIGSALFLVPIWSGRGTWEEEGWTASVGGVMLAILTMVATNLTALRDRREHTAEQHGTLPVGPAARTGGLLAAALWPAAGGAALFAGVVVVASSRGLRLDGPHLVVLIERVWSIVLLGAVGVALAAWLPRLFVAALVAWGLFFVNPGEEPRSWHSLVVFSDVGTFELAIWHLVYLIGLTGLFAVIALGRWERRMWVLVAGVLSVATVATSSIVLLGGSCPVSGSCLS